MQKTIAPSNDDDDDDDDDDDECQISIVANLPSSLLYVTPSTSKVHSRMSSIEVHWLKIRTRCPHFFRSGRSSANACMLYELRKF
jgi:hypothetical protein